jgi:hypothetical protein
MLEQLTIWTGKAMIAAWLSIGTLVGITPKDVQNAIAVASLEKPLPFEGVDAVRRTSALITATGVFESGYNNKAQGDCKDKPPGWPGCGKTDDSKPTSFCFLQVHFIDGVERVKGYTPEELMADPLACARAGREIMRDSIEVSKKEKKRLEGLGRGDEWTFEPLKAYAGTSSAARKRFDLAVKLFKTVDWPYRCDD